MTDRLATPQLLRASELVAELEALRDRIPDGLGRSREPVTVPRATITDCGSAVNTALWLCDRLAEVDTERAELETDREAQTEWPTEDGWLRDQHARYHDQRGNMLGRDECGWERCEFWDAAVWVLNAPRSDALDGDE